MRDHPFVLNSWYMAGWAEELQVGQLLARKLLDQPIVLFRAVNGEPVALQDRCPHRIVPLSKGELHGDVVQCVYHGLRFDRSGRCVSNPHGTIPDKAAVRAYPIVERHGILWVWFGSASKADAALIPDLADLYATPASTHCKGAMPTDCHYQLITDNVMDLSHVEFLHARSLGGGAFIGGKPEVSQDGNRVRVIVRASGQKAPPVYAQWLDHPNENVIFSNEVIWEPVGVMRLNIDVEPDGPSRGTPLYTRNVHIVTPETTTRSHYWYWLTRSFKADDLAITERRGSQMSHVFQTEDKPILESQQALIGDCDLFDAKPILLSTDSGGVRTRRIVDEFRRREVAAV